MSTVADDPKLEQQVEAPVDKVEEEPVSEPVETASETPEQPETPPETGEDAPPETPPEPEPEVPAAPSAPEWITDNYRDVAASYGLGDDDLSGFESAVEFQRACQMVDRLTQRRSAKPEETPVATPETKAPVTTAPPEEEPIIDLAKYDGYDEDTLQLVKVTKWLQDQNKNLRGELSGVSGKFEKALSAIQQEREEEAMRLELDRFHEVMDGMDAKLFGGDGALTPELDKRRESVWEAYKQLRGGYSDGVPRTQAQRLSVMRGLVHRAALLSFGEDMLKSQRDSIHRSIHEQSKKRRPAPSKGKVLSPAAPHKADPKTIHEAAREIANDPDIAALFDRYLEAGGNVPQ